MPSEVQKGLDMAKSFKESGFSLWGNSMFLFKGYRFFDAVTAV